MKATIGQSGALALPRGRPLLVGAEIALFAIVYIGVALGSLEFASINPSATPIWPPTGLALGLVLLRGPSLLPAILVGAFAANVMTAGTAATSAAIAVGNTLEAFIGAMLLSRWAGGPRAFESPSGLAKFAVTVAAVSTPVSATIGVSALAAGGFAAWPSFPAIWATWWLGDLAGAVMVAPALVLWAKALRSPQALRQEAGETLLIFACAASVGAVAFSPLIPPFEGKNALAFLAALPLLWAALRRPPRETAAVALILSGFAVWGVTAGAGPFIQPTLNASFLLLVSFIVSITMPSLALSAAVTSRDRAIVQGTEDYRRLVDSVRDYAIFMLDMDGRVLSWNSGAARMNQYRAEEILGRHFECFYTPKEREAGEPALALRRAAESGVDRTEGWRLRRDGARFRASVLISAIGDERGTLAGFAVVMQDITNVYEAQEALEEARERLLQAQKLEAIGKLTGGVAHDFNNLLMVLAGGLRFLARGSDPEQRGRIADEMQGAIERGAGLTRQLLAFARREQLQPEVVDVAARIAGIRRLLERSLSAAIAIEVDIPPDLPPVDVDPVQFDLVILNLAVNARDAMPSGGTLMISASAPADAATGEDAVCLSVRDTGVGMPADVQARAFEPFYSTKSAGRGTGLGLSLVNSFAVQSGGSAEIESAVGAGTTVTLRLPRAARPAVPAGQRPQPIESADAAGAVLVVEDDDGVAAVVCEMIAQLGYRPTRVENAGAALGALERARFDIVFSDIVMPGGMNGLELADEIRRRVPDLPIVLSTGYFSQAETACRQYPILRKPYDAGDLGRALAAVREAAPAAS